MNRIKLTKEEKEIENALMRGEFTSIKGKELANIEKALKARKKDITMTIRVNSEDIEKIKIKAKKVGVKYQSYISEVIHQVAEV
jgi:predicted DNA binding CopG/RHH family protein